MKKIAIIIASLCLSACATNGEIDYGKTALFIGSAVVVGYLLAEKNAENDGMNCYYVIRASGSSQVCR